MVRLARFERATFGSGDRRSSPAELQAHVLILQNLVGVWKTKKEVKICLQSTPINKCLRVLGHSCHILGIGMTGIVKPAP